VATDDALSPPRPDDEDPHPPASPAGAVPVAAPADLSDGPVR
jgi:hypothetical protein